MLSEGQHTPGSARLVLVQVCGCAGGGRPRKQPAWRLSSLSKLPRRWCRFAHVQDMDAGATSLAFRLGVGTRLPGPGEAAAAAARRLEERIGAAEGIANIRRWLLIIGAEVLDTAKHVMFDVFETEGQGLPLCQPSL